MNQKRFQYLTFAECADRGIPGDWETWEGTEDWDMALLEFDHETGEFVRVVATDGGEPEDNSFRRDYAWIVDEMNTLADEVKAGR